MNNKEKIFLILKWIKKALLYVFSVIFILALSIFVYANLPVAKSDVNAQIGVTFSQRYAEDIGLDWKKAYSAMLDELDIKYIRIPVYWDLVEKSNGEYDFSDLDWQLQKAKEANAHVILVVGEKVPRWPECYIPTWVGKNPEDLKNNLLAFEEAVVNRYKSDHPEISNWQVENEPFLSFGVCGAVSPTLLDAEIVKVKSLDPSRPIIVTDSGELSMWIPAASRADVFGTTMYREVVSSRVILGHPLGQWKYPIGPNFFKIKQWIIKIFAHQNNPIVIELQGEPWVNGWTTNAPLDEQLASMNAQKLSENVEFAKKTGMKQIYVWGVEWWYWMKETQNNPTLWEQAKKISQQ